MYFSIFGTYNTSKEERRRRHLSVVLLAIAVSWALWCVVSIPYYKDFSGLALLGEVGVDLAEHIVETTVLIELSLLFCAAVARLFWKQEKTFVRMLLMVLIVAIFNVLCAFDYNCADYLMKPVQKADLEKALRHCGERFPRLTPSMLKDMSSDIMQRKVNYRKRLMLEQGTRTLVTPVEDVSHIAADTGGTKVFLKDGTHGYGGVEIYITIPKRKELYERLY